MDEGRRWRRRSVGGGEEGKMEVEEEMGRRGRWKRGEGAGGGVEDGKMELEEYNEEMEKEEEERI